MTTDKKYWHTDFGLSQEEWKHLDLILYGSWINEDFEIADLQAIRRALLETALKISKYISVDDVDPDVMDRAAEIELNILYELRDLDWKIEGLI